MKTCNFCSDACTQKSLCDQIIEGLLDGDIVEHLLQEKDLSLDKVICMCQAQEAAKKQRATIQQSPTHHDSVAALKAHPQKKSIMPKSLCPGCGVQQHLGGCMQCPVYHVLCHNCKKLGHFSRICCSKAVQPVGSRPSISSLQSTLPDNEQGGLSNIHHVTFIDPAPKLEIDITSTLNSATITAVLPDSGAGISAVGMSILSMLSEHIDNLLPSSVIPKAANGAEMHHPFGKLPVCFKLGKNTP